MRIGRRLALATCALVAAVVSLALPSARDATDGRTGRATRAGVLYRYVVTAPGEITEQRVEHAAAAAAIASVPARSVDAKGAAPARGSAASAHAPAAGRQVAFTEHNDPSSSSSSSHAPASSACPRATTCRVFQLQNARWKADATGKVTIPWRFNDAGRRNLRAPPGLLESALGADMAQWHHWDSNVNFVYGGTTTATFGARGKDGSCADGTNVIGWAKLDPAIIAETLTCTDSGGRYFRDADLALNVTYHWEDIEGTPKSRHSFDIRSIVMHELGHVLSLAHPDPDAGLYQTMMGNSVYGETRKRTPALGDVLGLQTAYPCGSGDSCPRSGIADD